MLGSKKMPRRSFVLRRRRSLKGISCCSNSFISGSLLSRRKIFLRGKLGLRPRLCGIGTRRPEGEDAGAAFYGVTDFYAQVGIAGEPEVGAGTEADQADAFATGDSVANFFPADYAPGNQAG